MGTHTRGRQLDATFPRNFLPVRKPGTLSRCYRLAIGQYSRSAAEDSLTGLRLFPQGSGGSVGAVPLGYGPREAGFRPGTSPALRGSLAAEPLRRDCLPFG